MKEASDNTSVTYLTSLNPGLVAEISRLAGADNSGGVLDRLHNLHPADVAVLLSHLSPTEAKKTLHWLPPVRGGEVLAELDDHFRARLLQDDDSDRISALLEALDSDDIADVLADLPEETAQRVLPMLEDAQEVGQLLGYGEETAGGIMATEYFAVLRGWSVEQVIEEMRQRAHELPDLLEVFITDETGRLEGTASLKSLLLTASDNLIDDVMCSKVVSVPTHEDQEEVARIMERYNLLVLPVVDGQGCLVGQITIDDVVDVIREEAEEDIQRMGGLSGDEEPTDLVWQMVKSRLPWLLGGLGGAGLAAMVVGSFDEALQQAVILAGFIPIIMATAGNVGIQSSAVAVQGLASGDILEGDIRRRLGKEVAVAMINGIVAASVIALVILALSFVISIHEPARLALTAGLALIAVILLAAVIGATVPLILYRLGVDPALATGPFITTSNDILGVLIFFQLATVLYLP
ncbi:MAG: magnesium transporter [Gammaproteobacteria bacterium]|nr:magnesium transporter [Gammaproteobacteria bacterium]